MSFIMDLENRVMIVYEIYHQIIIDIIYTDKSIITFLILKIPYNSFIIHQFGLVFQENSYSYTNCVLIDTFNKTIEFYEVYYNSVNIRSIYRYCYENS